MLRCFFVLILVFVSYVCTEGYNQYLHTRLFKFPKIEMINTVKASLAVGTIGGFLLLQPQSALCLEDISSTEYSEPATIRTTELNTKDLVSEKESQRIKRKLEAQTVAKPDGYLDSMKREQAKQNERKKSKASRASDLCESLGRGC